MQPSAPEDRNGLIVCGAEKEGVPTQLYTVKPDGTGAKQLPHVTEGERPSAPTGRRTPRG